MITHDREFFYKYVAADTAKAILRNGSIRWSSPRLFNDPFDVQFDLHLPFTTEEYTEAMVEGIKGLFANSRQGPVQSTNPYVVTFNNLFDLLRERLPNFSADQFIGELLPDIKEGAARAAAALPKIHAEVRELIDDLCVFCVSETHDNLLMWSHYADSHTGAVIKFKCLPEHDTALCAATRVTYQQEMPVWSSLEEVVSSNLGGPPLDHRKYLNAMSATKSDEWSYEKEWRVISGFRTKAEINAGFADYPIIPHEITGITFGCRMSDNDKVEIATLASSYPNASLSQATVHQKRFDLEFHAVA